MENFEFNEEKMKNLIKKDLFLKRSFNDLKKRNPSMSNNEVMEVLFNSYVLEDSVMRYIYTQA